VGLSGVAASVGGVVEPLTVPLYVTVGRADRPAPGYTWRIWSGGTSFYLKSRAPGMGHLKLSIHGDRPGHPVPGGYKIAMDTEDAFADALTAQTIVASRTGDWPIWFPRKEVANGSMLVARLRWTWDACTRLPPAPSPGELRKGAVGLAAPPPPQPGDAVDVDLIVTKGQPYWPQEQRARADNTCVGPLRNDADLWLTSTVYRRTVGLHPTHERALGPHPSGRADEMRGVGAAVDPDGFLWIVEQRLSRSGMAAARGDHGPVVEGENS